MNRGHVRDSVRTYSITLSFVRRLCFLKDCNVCAYVPIYKIKRKCFGKSTIVICVGV